MKRKPNVFIIGAPKCGTTSLAAWMAQHPDMYFSDPKEIHYFSSDIDSGYSISKEKYGELFSAAPATAKVIAEGSTHYLRSKVAVREILDYQADSKFIVCLRNLTEMSISWHGQMLFQGWENVRDFKTAWGLQEARQRGEKVPYTCPDRSHLIYSDVCGVGSQVEKLLTLTRRENVHFVFLDDMKDNPSETINGIIRFLGLDDTGGVPLEAKNEAREVPNYLSVTTAFIALLKHRLGIKFGFGWLTFLNRALGKKRKLTISDDFRRELNEHFEPEVRKLEVLIGVDLSHWRQNTSLR